MIMFIKLFINVDLFIKFSKAFIARLNLIIQYNVNNQVL